MHRFFEYTPITEVLKKAGYSCRSLSEGEEAVKGYVIKEQDVVFTHEASSVSGCQLTGKRYASKMEPQEDRFGTGCLSAFGSVNDGETEVLLKQFVETLQVTLSDNLKNDANSRGAAFCLAVTDKAGIDVVSVGDCRSYVVVWDENNNIVQCDRVNKALHNAHNLSEVARVATVQGINKDTSGTYDVNKVLPFGRLDGRLEMTRALGDNGLVGKGLSHEADYYHLDVTIPVNGRAVLMVSSDGLTEGWVSETKETAAAEQKKLQAVLSACKVTSADSVETIMFKLSKASIEAGSTDNVTVLGVELGQDKAPNYIYVADGHNGAQVSAEISKLAGTMLSEALAARVSQRSTN